MFKDNATLQFGALFVITALLVAVGLVYFRDSSIEKERTRMEELRSSETTLPKDSTTGNFPFFTKPTSNEIKSTGLSPAEEWAQNPTQTVLVIEIESEQALEQIFSLSSENREILEKTEGSILYRDGRVITTDLEKVGEQITDAGWIERKIIIFSPYREEQVAKAKSDTPFPGNAPTSRIDQLSRKRQLTLLEAREVLNTTDGLLSP